MQVHRRVSGIFIDTTFLEIEKLVIIMRIVKTFSKVSQFSEIAAKNPIYAAFDSTLRKRLKQKHPNRPKVLPFGPILRFRLPSAPPKQFS